MRIEKLHGLKLNFAAVLTGVFISMMFALMYAGGSFHLNQFSSSGRVFDFPNQELRQSSEQWLFDVERDGYLLQNDRSVIKFKLDGKLRGWNYLVLNIREMSAAELNALFVYYDNEGDLIAEQPVTLHQGENILKLDSQIKMDRMGIRALEAKGVFLALESMQVRNKLPAASYGSAAVVFLFVFLLYLLIYVTAVSRFPALRRITLHFFIEVLQYICCLKENRNDKCKRHAEGTNRYCRMRFLFCLLFLWMMLGSAAGIYQNPSWYRYYILIFCMLLLMITGLMRERKPVRMKWGRTAQSWLLLWILTCISDVFVADHFKFMGYIMLLLGTYFIFVWNQMQKKEIVLKCMMQSLEIDFIPLVLYCMVFRSKHPYICYNGAFRAPEMSAMYGTLMFSVFAAEALHILHSGRRNRGRLLICLPGAGISVYFSISSGEKSALIAVGIVGAVCLYQVFLSGAVKIAELRFHLLYMACGVLISVLAVTGFRFAVKHLPESLNAELVYEQEQYVTDLPESVILKYDISNSEFLKQAVVKESLDKRMIWKNYLRKLNLLGNSSERLVFRQPSSAYSGYVFIMYRYGMFCLIPYLILQLKAVIYGGNSLGSSNYYEIWLFMIAIIFVAFCIGNNVEGAGIHPLWFCFYLGAGYYFSEGRSD